MQRKQAADFDQQVLDLYDDYAHGRISRRDFLEGATLFQVTGGSLKAMAGASGVETGESSSGTPSP